MTVESQPVIPSTTAILRRVQPPRSMTGRTAGYAPRAKNAACRLREHCFLHPQPAHPVLRSSSLLRDSTVTLVPINDNCEEKVWRRRHNARRVLKFTRPSLIHDRATKLLPILADRRFRCLIDVEHPTGPDGIIHGGIHCMKLMVASNDLVYSDRQPC